MTHFPVRPAFSLQPRRARAAALSLTLALAAAPALAQVATIGPATTTRPSTGPATGGAGGVTTQPGGTLLLNFKDASIDSVLDELSAVAGFIVVKETPITGRVSLVSKQPVTSADAVSLLNTVLKNAGYAAIQQDRILKIVPWDRAKRSNIPVHSGSDPSKIANTDELITQVIPLRQADAMQLKNDLMPLINTAEADFTANASSNALVITDRSANVKRLVEIVAALDGHLTSSADVRVMQLQYASASGAARLINDLFGEDANARRGQQQTSPFQGFFGGGGFPSRSSSSSSRQQEQQNPRSAVRINASADDRTNTVVVTGPPETLDVIERVVQQLDSNPASDETVFIYRVKNAQALSIEETVNLLFNGFGSTGNRSSVSAQQQLGSQRGGTTGGSRLGGTGSQRGGTTGTRGTTGFGGTGGFGSTGFGGTTFGGFGGTGGTRTGGFGGFGGSGALSQGAMQAASDLAGQVTIIADPDTNSLLVRTSPKNYERVKEILAELDRAVPQVLIKVLVAEVTHDRDLDVGAQFSVLNLRASGNGQNAQTNFGLANQNRGLVVQILEEDFTATIRALETAGKLDVLSRPYILASDNQLATITVGQEVPFIRNSRITEDGQTLNTIEYDDIGILLDVVPHINTDGLVILDVAPEISALTGSTVPISDTIDAPVIAKRSAQSRVGVMNGQTVVIGGLMEDRKTETIEKIPFLGDIPIIGNAFKRRQKTTAKTELLIFLTPHVAAMPEALSAMSADEQDGTKLVPNAVYPGAFDEHMKGLQRGATTLPTTREADPR